MRPLASKFSDVAPWNIPTPRPWLRAAISHNSPLPPTLRKKGRQVKCRGWDIFQAGQGLSGSFECDSSGSFAEKSMGVGEELNVDPEECNANGVGSPPISRVLSWAAIPLGPPLPAASSNLPGSSASNAIAPLFGLAPDEVCRAVRVATSAVGSYPTGSPLPDLLAEPSAVYFLLHCLSPWTACAACCARPLAGILLYGARTFLQTLSRPAAA
jgi:hypothetical protein